jgi:predicted nucleic acid-binding protein
MNGSTEPTLYIDTSVLILFVEGTSTVRESIIQRFTELSSGSFKLAASPLTMLECLVKPLRMGDRVTAEAYERFFQEGVVRIIEADLRCWRKATEVRARYSFTVPDALHLATAFVHNCDCILTRDARWRRFPDIRVEVL